MTWMTPFEATTSAFVTCALLSITLPPVASTAIGLPSTVCAELSFTTSCGHHFAGDDVVLQDLLQLLLVLGLEQAFDRAGGEFGEGFIGRREDGEGAGALEGVDQAGGLHGGDKGVELGRCGGVDNVGGGSGGSERHQDGAGGEQHF